MQASNTDVLSKETREALSASALTKKKKRKLKINRIKELIRSKPAGTIIAPAELMAEAGYDPNESKQYSAGFNFIQNLKKAGIIIQVDGHKKSTWSIPGDSKTVKRLPLQPTTECPTPPPLDTLPQSSADQTMPFIHAVEAKAKDFAWRSNSDSLREFVGHLKKEF